MNSRQLRRQRHTIKMAKRGLRKFGKSMGWLMMQESPLTQYLKSKRMDTCDGGTHIQESLIYSRELTGGKSWSEWNGFND